MDSDDPRENYEQLRSDYAAADRPGVRSLRATFERHKHLTRVKTLYGLYSVPLAALHGVARTIHAVGGDELHWAQGVETVLMNLEIHVRRHIEAVAAREEKT